MMNDQTNRTRFYLFVFFSIVIIAVIVLYYGGIMLCNDRPESDIISKPLVERGPILDRNGRILAIQTRLYSVTAWNPAVEKPEESAALLSNVLNIPEESILDNFRNNEGFIYVKRKISPTETEAIRALKEQKKLIGISLEPEYGRNYPEKTLTSHIIGYVGTDNTGLSGIEYTFENELSPEPHSGSETEIYGNQLFLTIDVNVQHFTERIAAETYAQHNADLVTILVMEAKTGDVLSYVSLPNFDPNVFQAFSSEARKNHPISYSYEPGSVFKVFSLSSFMEIGGISPHDTFFCEGFYIIDSPSEEIEKLQCLGYHGSVTPEEIIQYSCNAGAAYASETVDKHAFHRMLKNFGFGAPTGLPLAGESIGLLRDPDKWSYRSKPTIAIGQEVSVTAVQMITAATVFANEGFLLQPHIIKKIVSPEGDIIEENKPTKVSQVLSKEVAERMLSMMYSATEPEGTASRVVIDGIATAAKTGTAQMLDRETGKYSEEGFIPSCLALFPAEDPEFIVYVVIVHPKAGEFYGGRIAAPVIKQVNQELIRYYGIPRTKDVVVNHPGKITLIDKEPLTAGDILPDLTGLSKRDLLPLFEKREIHIIIKGEGWVVSQYPAPGTPVTKDMEVVVELQ